MELFKGWRKSENFIRKNVLIYYRLEIINENYFWILSLTVNALPELTRVYSINYFSLEQAIEHFDTDVK
jgi:hypothetical protein